MAAVAVEEIVCKSCNTALLKCLEYLLKHMLTFLASRKKLGNFRYVQTKKVFRYIHVYVYDTPYSLKVEVQFRLRDSYHFPIASGLEIGKQEVFSSTWQL